MKVRKFFGGPGTGKTEALISELMKEAEHVPLNEICYITFTRAAKNEVLARVKKKFPQVEKSDLRNFSTQHSICFRLLGLKKEQVIGSSDKQAICDAHGIEYIGSEKDDIEDVSVLAENTSEGGRVFGCFDRIRAGGMQVNHETISLFLPKMSHVFRLTAGEVHAIWSDYQKYKHRKNMYDFADMLQTALRQKLVPDMKVLFADEFQDFGKLQYDLYRMWADHAERVYVAGDDDQSIYTFLSASPEFMLKEVGEEIVLPKNYRTPSNIYSFAKTIIRRNIIRKEKNIICVNEGGSVSHITSDVLDDSFFDGLRRAGAKRFFLLRTNYYAQKLAELFVAQSVPFVNLHSGSSWTHNLVLINNCIAKAQRDELIDFCEIRELISSLPSLNILRRGAKKEVTENFINEARTFSEWKNRYFSLNGVSLSVEELIPFLKITKKQKEILTATSVRGFSVLDGVSNYIGTMHSSKGLEADEVYLFDSLPAKVRAELPVQDALEAERKLYYVACTRAKKKLFIIYDFIPRAGSFLQEYA